MPDGAPQTGQRGTRVYRFSGCPKDSFIQYEPNVTWDNATPGVWHSLDPKALSATHAVIDALVAPYTCSDSLTIQILSTLGLTPPRAEGRWSVVSGIEGVLMWNTGERGWSFCARSATSKAPLARGWVPYTAFPEPVALALVAVAEAARVHRNTLNEYRSRKANRVQVAKAELAIFAALDALAEAQAEAT